MKTNITLSKSLMINNEEIFEYSVDLSNEVNIILQWIKFNKYLYL